MRILGKLGVLIGAAAADEAQEPARLVDLHPLAQGAVADLVVAVEHHLANPDLRPLIDVERQMHQLRTAGHGLRRRRHGGKLIALFGVQGLDHARHAAHHGVIHRGIQPQVEAQFLQLALDVGDGHFLRARVINNLDAAPFFDQEHHLLADDTVRIDAVHDLDPHVVNKRRRKQPIEVRKQRRLGRRVVGHPRAARERPGRLRAHVVEVGLGRDRGEHVLGDELQFDTPEYRADIGRGQRRRLRLGGRLGLLGHRGRRLGRRAMHQCRHKAG